MLLITNTNITITNNNNSNCSCNNKNNNSGIELLLLVLHHSLKDQQKLENLLRNASLQLWYQRGLSTPFQNPFDHDR